MTSIRSAGQCTTEILKNLVILLQYLLNLWYVDCLDSNLNLSPGTCIDPPMNGI